MRPLVVTAASAIAAAGDPSLDWLDAVSRVGVVGILVLALYGLQKRWWVPGWAYRELLDRHENLRQRYDDAVTIALQSSKGVQKSASILEQAIEHGRRQR